MPGSPAIIATRPDSTPSIGPLGPKPTHRALAADERAALPPPSAAEAAAAFRLPPTRERLHREWFRQAARLSRRRYLQLRPQAASEIVERHARGGDLPSGGKAPDEPPVGVLSKRIKPDAAPRQANGVVQRAGRLGVRGQALQRVADAVAVGLAGVVDPLPVESGQQLTVTQLDGLLEPSNPDESLELPGVHE